MFLKVIVKVAIAVIKFHSDPCSMYLISYININQKLPSAIRAPFL